ncbi:tyrosine-type recombinase/integrase [Methanococcoides sp. AM1]|uniref:tyrosine-type recombinase/integrase n=1 Tax=Methanococcoides sp. AM1 TaxID=1201011 RepID=UPI001082B043|nr:tyrosine-type recombinase/integrase [Methanococcoides sp. AM1]
MANEDSRIHDNEKERIKALNARQLKRLLENTNSDTKRKLYQRFINSYIISGASVYTIRNHLSALLQWDSIIIKEYNELTDIDIENALIELENSDMSDSSKKTRQINLKTFLNYAGLEELSDKIKIRKVKRKLPDELLTADDIDRLINACQNQRDKAVISLLYESGARLGEMLSLQIKHLEPHDKGMYVQFPDGKTGARRIMVVYSAMYMNQWIMNHPNRRDPESFLWCQIGGTHEVLTIQSFRKLLKSAAKRAGITKPVNPHAFRHAQATELAKDFTEQTLKRYLGWTADSKMAATYVHLASKDVDEAVLKRAGIEIEERDTRLRMDECPRCHKLIKPDMSFCGFCGLPLTKEVTTENNDTISGIIEVLKNNPEILMQALSKAGKE